MITATCLINFLYEQLDERNHKILNMYCQVGCLFCMILQHVISNVVEVVLICSSQ